VPRTTRRAGYIGWLRACPHLRSARALRTPVWLFRRARICRKNLRRPTGCRSREREGIVPPSREGRVGGHSQERQGSPRAKTSCEQGAPSCLLARRHAFSPSPRWPPWRCFSVRFGYRRPESPLPASLPQ